MLFSILGAAMLAAALDAAPVRASDFVDEARHFIEIKGNETIQVFGIKDRKTRYDRFRVLLAESFAIKGIAKFVIGRFWNSATPDQKDRYLKLFKDYIVANYAAKSWIIDDVKLRVIKVIENNENDVSVDTFVHLADKEKKDVPLGFRVRKGEKGIKIIDLKVEGVSLIISHRSEFTSVIGKYGGDLNKFNDSLAERTKKIEKKAKLNDAKLSEQQAQ